MSEIEVDLDGTEVEVVCRKCDGKGLVSYEKAIDCDECDGEGSYFAIVKQGTIHVDVLPRYA